MKINIRTIAVMMALSLMSGCVAYPAYSPYSAAYGPGVAPYGGYGYGLAPVVPVPMFGGGWGYGGHRGYGHYRHY